MTSEDLPRMRRLRKSAGLWLRRQTASPWCGRGGPEDPLGAALEELTHEEPDEEEAEERKLQEEGKGRIPQKSQSEGVAAAFADLNQLLGKSVNRDANLSGLITTEDCARCSICVQADQ